MSIHAYIDICEIYDRLRHNICVCVKLSLFIANHVGPPRRVSLESESHLCQTQTTVTIVLFKNLQMTNIYGYILLHMTVTYPLI